MSRSRSYCRSRSRLCFVTFLLLLKGKGVAGALVSLDGKQVAKTDAQGLYAIDGMKAGTYTISIKASSLYFDDARVKVMPSDPTLPKMIPSK